VMRQQATVEVTRFSFGTRADTTRASAMKSREPAGS
jgi:hypothetical protein